MTDDTIRLPDEDSDGMPIFPKFENRPAELVCENNQESMVSVCRMLIPIMVDSVAVFIRINVEEAKEKLKKQLEAFVRQNYFFPGLGEIKVIFGGEIVGTDMVIDFSLTQDGKRKVAAYFPMRSDIDDALRGLFSRDQ